MKRILGILILSIMMISTFSFAAYPAELENEVEEGLEVYGTLNEEDLADYDLIDLTSEEESQIEPREGEITEQDIYRLEDEVIVNETVDANVYVMGETVKIEDAVIYGNLYAMGKNIEISNSEIDGSVYVLGENVNFSGIANDIYACADEVNFDLDAYIWRNAKIGSRIAKINGTIERDASIATDELSLGDNAVISGKLEYYSSKEGNISENAEIASVDFIKEEITKEDSKVTDKISDYLYDIVSIALKTLIVALIIVFCIHKFENLKRTDNPAVDLLKVTGKGLGVLILMPVIFILLICSIVGIGIGFVLLALYLVALYISISIIALEIAYRILNSKKDEKLSKGKLIGISVFISIVIWAIGLIPGIGGIIKFVLILMGLGILFDMIFQKKKKEKGNEN